MNDQPATGESTVPAATWPQDVIAVVPVYNHGATVGTVVSELRALGAEVITIDDGSSDSSGPAAAQAGAELLTHSVNQGKAAALITGMTRAWQRGFNRALTIDADGQHPMSAVRLLLEQSTDASGLYIGRRDMAGAPFISCLGRRLSNFGSWLASGALMGDSQSGLRIYPLPLTLQLPVPAERYAYEIEVLVRAAWAGTAIHSVVVPVIYPEDRVSHFNKLRDNVRATKVLLRLVIRRLWPIRPALGPVPEQTQAD
ncbi:MAG: glycosyltransferase family 2 protein [Planctomycetota bacterium]|jgi:glycosyltransferase involved in cell wall biosynthesis